MGQTTLFIYISKFCLPFLHSCKVKCHLSVGKCFFIQVSTITPYEGGHVITCKKQFHILYLIFMLVQKFFSK